MKDIELETIINNGEGKIDITFTNKADNGFFHDLVASHGLKCPYIFIECKNLTEDLKPNDFQQLSERLTTTKNQFGILICRGNTNEKNVLSHVKTRSTVGERLVMWLEDDDLIEMLRNSEKTSEVDSVLEKRAKKIQL